jgi:hypothetical protein
MYLWREDFTTCSLEEIMARHAENRAWSKELRLKTNALVNTRLARTISLADYMASRKLAHDDAAECRRRASVLERQINRHAILPVPQEV